jgi:hypothetical protein
MKILSLVLLLTSPLLAQGSAAPGSWKALGFLEGTWAGKTQGSRGASTSGKYTFQRELDGHILARHSTNDPGCKGPVGFDCQQSDLLYVYEDAPSKSLKAIYFDNEGHVIHYDVSTPDATTAVFLSDASQSGPRFRLLYELKGSVMTGRFQVQMPGQTEWKSYLEWSGGKE